jgi:hypothetical protein
MTTRSIIALAVLSTLVLATCVFRTEDSQIDSYIDDVNRTESNLVSELETLLLANPVVYDDAVAAQSSQRQIGDGFSKYYSAAIPHVDIAITELNNLSPPDNAVVFHELFRQWLVETKELMEDGLLAFGQLDESSVINVLGRMATLSAKRDLLAIELGKLER